MSHKPTKPLAITLIVTAIVLPLAVSSLWYYQNVLSQWRIVWWCEAKGGAVAQRECGPRWLNRTFGACGLPVMMQVTGIDLRMCAITDDDLGRLSAATYLTRLRLDGTKITDAGLQKLSHLNGLQFLELWHTAVTDEGLEYLLPMVDLRYVTLIGTRITDAGVGTLLGLKRLQGLDVRGTAVTAPAARELEKQFAAAGQWVIFDYDDPVADQAFRRIAAEQAEPKIMVQQPAPSDR